MQDVTLSLHIFLNPAKWFTCSWRVNAYPVQMFPDRAQSQIVYTLHLFVIGIALGGVVWEERENKEVDFEKSMDDFIKDLNNEK